MSTIRKRKAKVKDVVPSLDVRALARHWPLLAAELLLLTLALALGAAVVRSANGHIIYALDDPYIQMAIAKNLAAHGVWGVTRYGFSGAGSSLLWPLLLAGVDRLAGPGERAPFVLNVICSMAAVGVAYSILRRHVANAAIQFSVLALMVVAIPLTLLPVVGMEHALQVAASLAVAGVGIRSCTASSDRERRVLFIWTLVASAVVVAVRYDTASVLVALIVVVVPARGWRDGLLLAVCAAVPAAVYGVVARANGWPWVPVPVLVKERMVGIDGMTWHGLANMAGAGALTALVREPVLFVLVAVALAQLAWPGPEQAGNRRARERRFLLMVFAGATLIHAQFGQFGSMYRYEAYLVALGIVANAASLAHRFPAPWPRLSVRWAALVALAALAIYPLVLRGFSSARDAVAQSRNLYGRDYQVAQFFRRYPRQGALMMADIGFIAYFTDAPIVDVGGLATLELTDMVRRNRPDSDLVLRVARAHDVGVSMSGNPGRGDNAWTCVAAWTTDERRPDNAIYLFAANRNTASTLERDLRAFAAEDAAHVVNLTFADQMTRPCPN